MMSRATGNRNEKAACRNYSDHCNALVQGGVSKLDIAKREMRELDEEIARACTCRHYLGKGRERHSWFK